MKGYTNLILMELVYKYICFKTLCILYFNLNLFNKNNIKNNFLLKNKFIKNYDPDYDYHIEYYILLNYMYLSLMYNCSLLI